MNQPQQPKPNPESSPTPEDLLKHNPRHIVIGILQEREATNTRNLADLAKLEWAIKSYREQIEGDQRDIRTSLAVLRDNTQN